MEDGLVLPGPQTAQAEGLVLTTVEEGGDEGHAWPLLGPAVQGETVGFLDFLGIIPSGHALALAVNSGPLVLEPRVADMLHLPGAPPTYDVLAG